MNDHLPKRVMVHLGYPHPLLESLGLNSYSVSDPASCQYAWEAADDSISTWAPVEDLCGRSK